jgi:hypothetical protein
VSFVGYNRVESKMSWRKLQASKTRTSLFVSFLAVCSVLGYVSAAAFDEVSKPHLFRRGGAVNSVVLDRPEISTEDEIMETADDLAIVFSDIDGTLLHYPTPTTDDQEKGAQEENSNGNRILELPPSSTGMIGVISSKTLSQCQDVRREGVKLVLVSGMRSSTLLKRLPFLPRADAYCCEAGGRIFYPVTNSVQQNEDAAGLTVTPAPYDGVRAEDLEAFGLVEDMDWRREMERIDAAGKDGFVSNELGDDNNHTSMSIADREGSLWEFARRLQADGYVLDTKGYATCFRVNRNQQTPGMSKEAFDGLIDGTVACPPELSTSTNLGCVDFYPVASGKKNWYVPFYCIELFDLTSSLFVTCMILRRINDHLTNCDTPLSAASISPTSLAVVVMGMKRMFLLDRQSACVTTITISKWLGHASTPTFHRLALQVLPRQFGRRLFNLPLHVMTTTM